MSGATKSCYGKTPRFCMACREDFQQDTGCDVRAERKAVVAEDESGKSAKGGYRCMDQIFITYCSWQKDDTIKDTGKTVRVEHLYTSPRIVEFIEKCKSAKVTWGILSDKHGICLEGQEYEWYDLHPESITNEEMAQLKEKVLQQLASFPKIFFYAPAGELHPVYRKIIDETPLKYRTRWISRLDEITV